MSMVLVESTDKKTTLQENVLKMYMGRSK